MTTHELLLLIANAVICSAIAIRVGTFRRNGSQHRRWGGWIAYFLIVASASIPVRAGRITQDQANALGRKTYEKSLPLERQRAIANLVYSKRMGNNGPGDGWNYRGRGLIQITGLNNYRDCGNGLKVDLVAQPELLAQDEYAARSAAWFFATKGCMKYTGGLVRVTQIINGGQNGIDDRRARYGAARKALL